MTLELTKKDVRRVARRVVETLEQGGYTCCLYGSAACSVYGMGRVPAVSIVHSTHICRLTLLLPE